MTRVSTITSNRRLKVMGLLLLAIYLSLCLLYLVQPSRTVNAASAADFNAGRIIDDAVFFNAGSMNASQIQAFLESKAPGACNYTTDAWHILKSSAPNNPNAYNAFCLKELRLDTKQREAASGYCAALPERKNITAAQFIYNVAQACGINPQTLLTLLEKEQGMITDKWINTLQYGSSTGYACPDFRTCDPRYAGFDNQIYEASRQFKVYQKHPNNYNYIAGRDSNILWQTNGGDFISDGKASSQRVIGKSTDGKDIYGCGKSQVNIQNQATAALYIYTPYRPNSAALSSYPGTGDACSAYGNRNFWFTFTNWFGSTYNQTYHWTPHTQQSFTNGSASTNMPTTGRVQGDKVYLIVKVKNTGSATWKKGQVNLALSNPIGRMSGAYDSSWPSKDRPAYFYENSVLPGGEATYGFWANLKKSGTYREYFSLVADGITWMNDMGLYYEFQVTPAKYTSQYIEQTTYTDQTKSTAADTSIMSMPGNRYYNVLKIKNTGNITWRQGYVNLGTAQPTDRQSPSRDTTWPSANRVATFNEPSVAPGAVATFEFWTKTPRTIGVNREYFNLVAENITWFADYGIHYSYRVNKPYEWLPAGQVAYVDQAKSATKDISSMQPGERAYIEVKVRNTGTNIWKRGALNIATSQPADRTSKLRTPEWLSVNRAATLAEEVVLPGEIGTFNFWIKTPEQTGAYKEYFSLVAENITWLTDYGLHLPIKVQ